VSGSGNGSAKKDDEEASSGLAPAEDAASDTAPAPGGSELETLRKQLEALRAERDELREQVLRRRAEFENFRKRAERDRNQAGFEATTAVFREIIPTIDNLERALEAGGDEGSLRMGVELIHRELLSLLDNHGVTAHDPKGEPFDPERHQALSHEAVPGVSEGTVVETFRKGYYFKDRLLRPALVKVAKGEESAEEGEAQETDGVH
jgi:molecular chaperone GrpE